jgi:LacI family transcriptional regulator
MHESPLKDITIREIAKSADVAISTVSNVISGKKYVSPQIRQRVEAALAQFNYEPNAIAQNLRRNRDDTIAFVVPLAAEDTSDMYFMSIVFGIEESLRNRFHFVLAGSREESAEQRAHIKLFHKKRVCGLIIAPTDDDISFLHDYFQPTFPIVVVDRDATGFPADKVLVDGYQGTKHAVTELAKNGCKRVGFLSGPLDISTAVQRLQGYKDALRNAGIEVDQKLIKSGGPATELLGYQLTSELLDDPLIDGLFLANNVMAIGAVRLLRERSTAIPESMKVVVYDDHPWERLTSPPMNAVRQPTVELGRATAKLILDRIDHPKREPRVITMKTQYVQRGSV